MNHDSGFLAEWRQSGGSIGVCASVMAFARTPDLRRRRAPGRRASRQATVALSVLLAGSCCWWATPPSAAADRQQPGSQLTIIRSDSGIDRRGADGGALRDRNPEPRRGAVPTRPYPRHGRRRRRPARPRCRPGARSWACRRPMASPLRVLEADCADALRHTGCTRRLNRSTESDGLGRLGNGPVWWNASPWMRDIYDADSFWPRSACRAHRLRATCAIRRLRQIQFYPGAAQPGAPPDPVLPPDRRQRSPGILKPAAGRHSSEQVSPDFEGRDCGTRC